jgi:capsular polysaccharide biosynthesis protein
MRKIQQRISVRERSIQRESDWGQHSANLQEDFQILKLEIPGSRGATPSTLMRVKKSLIGRFYINYLKPIPLIRRWVIWLWRTMYPVYARNIAIYLGSKAGKRWRPLVRHKNYVCNIGVVPITVFDGANVDTPVPKVFPSSAQRNLLSPHDHYLFPPVYVFHLKGARVYGGTNIAFVGDTAICHDLYDFKLDYTSEELHGRHVIDSRKFRLRLLSPETALYKLPVAATFLDACASNYAHWLTEVLPRIAAFCTVKNLDQVPLVVNEGLHPNIIESLALIVGAGRKIITLPVGTALDADKLYVTSVAGYVPFERRNKKAANHSNGLFCSQSLCLVRDKVSSWVVNLPQENWPRKIYLRRTSGGRKIVNEGEFEGVLRAKGFVIIDPEKIEFLRQVAIFRSAETIVGPSGAALANLIFCSSNAKIYILIGMHEGTSYWYWQNIACASGKKVNYILGKIKSHSDGIHSDFSINIGDFIQALGEDA